VNAFPAYDDTVVVGSDAGWWLPYYTQRTTTLPPILYSTERLAPDVNRQSIRQIVFDIRASVRETGGDPTALRAILCDNDITHIYLGDRQGEVGFGDTRLIEPEWLQQNADFVLLNQTAEAQVWSFDRSVCQQPR
jgi:hypothetical protein